MPYVHLPADLYNRIRSGSLVVSHMSPPEHRFWKRVNVNGPVHPVWGRCWIWTGPPCHNGYGGFMIDHQQVRVHRWAYERFIGQIPHELSVLHRCDTPACVRPEHLFLGTTLENQQDKVSKDRQAKGEANGFSKLTEEDVKEIRRRYRRLSYHNSNVLELAHEFGVTPVNIRYILAGKAWKHVS